MLCLTQTSQEKFASYSTVLLITAEVLWMTRPYRGRTSRTHWLDCWLVSDRRLLHSDMEAMFHQVKVVPALSVSKEPGELLSKGGFHLTKCLSNSRKVVELIPEGGRAAAAKNMEIIEIPLGVQWQVDLDTFGLSISLKDRPVTRRGALSLISSVYDPLGFVAPFILTARVILQDLCKRKLDWGDCIPDQDLGRWQTWLCELQKLEHFHVERSIPRLWWSDFLPTPLLLWLITTCLQCCRLRLVNDCGDVHCSFLMGKSRLSPFKPGTIPRMELSAAVLSTRLDRLIRD